MQTQTLNNDHSTPLRLDTFLAQAVPEYSRTFWQKMIDGQNVTVNDKVAPNGRLLVKAGDQISYQLTIKPIVIKKAIVNAIVFDIIFENQDFLVINKPAGLLVHSTSPESSEISLFEMLEQQAFNQNSPLERAGLIHRLDKETSGIILIAKNPSSQFKLSQLFAERTIEKTYLAIVVGHPEPTGIIERPLGRHPNLRHKRTINGVGAKEAHTSFKVQQYFENYSLLEVKIATGRTHQIRVHLSSIGFPVLGDFLYGKTTHLIARQALHASSLSFAFEGVNYHFTAEMPSDFAKLLQAKLLNTE